jgi:flagellar protein FlbD
MIRLTRLNKQAIILNSDLIKWVESSPDTVITLITGEKLVVLESCDDIIDAVLQFRRQVSPSTYARLPHPNADAINEEE